MEKLKNISNCLVMKAKGKNKAMKKRLAAQWNFESVMRDFEAHNLTVVDIVEARNKLSKEIDNEMEWKHDLLEAEMIYELTLKSMELKMLKVEAKMRGIDISGEIK